MTNRNASTTIKSKLKYGVTSSDPTYLKAKNKGYYEASKTKKSSLINYYKVKYGEHLVLNLIECLGVDLALEQLKKYRQDIKQSKIENPLLAISISIPIHECY